MTHDKKPVSVWKEKPKSIPSKADLYNLAEKWILEAREYPSSSEGRLAASAVVLCARELRMLLDGRPA